jgi:tetratricopeptide (TPR) repeat protein
VSWAKTLCGFATAGVTLERIRKSLGQLKRWLPDVEQPLAQLAVLEKDGKLVVRLEEGKLADTSGQRLLDFVQDAAPATMSMAPGPQAADDWFRTGQEHEELEQWTEAVKAYRNALLAGGPDADTSFNLGNVLHAMGRKAQAAERFRQAVETNPGFVEAWNNLGTVLADLEEHEDAIEAFQRVLQLNPLYADAHYNLADALEQTGRKREARPHWEAYFRSDPGSPWGIYARQRMTGS